MDDFDMIQSYVETAEEEYGVDRNLINAVIHSESSFRPDAKSTDGNLGLMQISETVAKQYGVTDPLDPIQNIRAGTQYLKDLLTRYKGDRKKALAAYHMGPTAFDDPDRDPGPQTRKYVKKVSKLADQPERVQREYNKKGFRKRSLQDFYQSVQ